MNFKIRNLNKKTITAILIIGFLVIAVSVNYFSKQKAGRLPKTGFEERLKQGNPPELQGKPEIIKIEINPNKVKEQVNNPENKGKFIVADILDMGISRVFEDESGKIIILGYNMVKENGERKFVAKMATFNPDSYKFSDVKIIDSETYNEKINQLDKKNKNIYKKLKISKDYYQIIELKDGKFLLYGHEPNMYHIFEVKVYDPVEDKVTIVEKSQIKPMPVEKPRGLLFQEKFFLLFRTPNIVEIFDIVKQKKIFSGKTLYKHYGIEPVFMKNDKFLFAGGYIEPRTVSHKIQEKSEIFDSVTKKFYETGSLICGRHNFNNIALEDGNALILGNCPPLNYRLIINTEEKSGKRQLAEIYVSE